MKIKIDESVRKKIVDELIKMKFNVSKIDIKVIEIFTNSELLKSSFNFAQRRQTDDEKTI